MAAPPELPSFPSASPSSQPPRTPPTARTLSVPRRATRFADEVYHSPTPMAATSPGSPSSTLSRTPYGWRHWHRVAFNRIRGQTLSVSPGSNFAYAVTLDMRAHEKTARRQAQQADSVITRARVRAVNTVEEMQEWILAALVGAFTACSAAWVEFILEHLGDLRFGFCRGMVWLHRDFCCGSTSSVDLLGNRCVPATAATGQWGLGNPGDVGLDPTDPFKVGNFVHHMDTLSDPSLTTSLLSENATWISWGDYVSGILPTFLASWSSLFIYVFVSTSLAVFAAVFCKRIAPAAGGSGIPEVKTILGGFSLPNVLAPWTLLTKVIGLAMAVASGLGLGKEGPMVHVGACWAAVISSFTWSPLDPSRQAALISAGSAAGVSTAFGAPVGGVLFALEEVSTYFPPSTLYRTLMCCVVASLVLKRVSPSGSGNGTVFQLDAIAMQGRWEIVELIPFVLLAATGGIVGALFIKLNVHLQTFRQRARRNKLTKTRCPRSLIWIFKKPVREVLIVALIFSSINFLIPLLTFPSTLLMRHMFTRCGKEGPGFHDTFELCNANENALGSTSTTYTHNTSTDMFISLGVALLIYFVNSLVTLGLNLPAGLFIPCLTIGSLLGRIFGLLTIKLDHKYSFMNCRSCIHPGVYSLLGAVAVLGGVTRMTVSLVVIAFEMTGGLGYIVPFMLVTLVARWVAEYFVEPSVYDWYIRLKRLPFLHPSPQKADLEVACGRYAADVMDRDVVCVSVEDVWNIGMARTLTREFQYSTYPIVLDSKSKILLGTINRRRLIERLSTLNTDQKVPSRALIHFGWLDPTESPDKLSAGLDFSDLVEMVPIQISPHTSLLEIHHIFLQLGISYLLITDQGSLKGILTKKAFLSRLERLRGAAV